ncbi:MAG: D-glycero-beta-D-manno-heptose-7-phosphate kinase [Candidatus Eremiobacteraeota bacterium]|nr:D-glycero-beta-D-manno-heptose-7-phosphate kinase [Candidatus Eremiobacteraeota bacterium]
MMPQMISPAQTLFERAAHLRILVVGDLMIDEWIWGSVTRISPEAPVPVVAVTDHSFTLGGAGNVANNLRALRAQVLFAGTVGNDDFAGQVRDLLRGESVDDSGVFTTTDRPTTRKTRVVAHNQQVVRADWESTTPLCPMDRHRLASFVAERAAQCDAVILSDYAKGLLCREIVEAAQACRLVLADPKPQNISIYGGITCVAPNVAEASAMTGIAITDDGALEAAAARLLAMLRCRYAVITRGEHGMALFGSDGERLQIPSVARTVYDVSGAGDTVTAVLALGLAGGVPIEATMQLANFAAGVVVEKLGTATASPQEILALLDPASE